MGLACSLTAQDARIGMLAVTVPALTGCEYGCVEADLGAKDLILILAPEPVFKAAHPLDDLTSGQDAGWHSRLVPQEKRE